MALADITLNDGQAVPVGHVFSYVSSSGNRVVRLDLSANPETPLQMTHAHTDKTVGGAKVKSHLFRIDKTILDADGVSPYPCNIRIMADIPDRVFSEALADDFAAFLRNWATNVNIRAWMRGSVG